MDLTGEQIEQMLEQQAVAGRPGGRDVLIFGISQGFTFAYNPEEPFGDRINPASIQLNGHPGPGDQLPDRHQQLPGRRRRLVHRVHPRDEPPWRR
jgi:hypothetical protein